MIDGDGSGGGGALGGGTCLEAAARSKLCDEYVNKTTCTMVTTVRDLRNRKAIKFRSNRLPAMGSRVIDRRHSSDVVRMDPPGRHLLHCRPQTEE
jgi:hypothetical protein